MGECVSVFRGDEVTGLAVVIHAAVSEVFARHNEENKNW